MEAAERFWSKVDVSGEHHRWLGYVDPARGTGQVRIDGRLMRAHRAAWELANGPLPVGATVEPCAADPLCVRTDHLRVTTPIARPTRTNRARKGAGSLRQVSPQTWELCVTAGRFDDGTPRRHYRRVRASSRAQAAEALANMVSEVSASNPRTRTDLDIYFDAAVERYLVEHLQQEKGREEKTVRDYQMLHRKWFSPTLGSRRLREVDAAAIDEVFGRMRAAGLSRSRLNQAKSLYAPMFRWAKRRSLVLVNPMADFELPTSSYVASERTVPEVEELCLLLRAAADVAPDIVAVLSLGAVTGARRGELVAVRRDRIDWTDGTLRIDAAVSETKRIKGTKTRRERRVHLDGQTLEMLSRHCVQMDERAAACGTTIQPDGFLFSSRADCSVPMSPDFLTGQVARVKAHLGIEAKRPETVLLEDEALRLFEEGVPKPRTTGPEPVGRVSYREIGKRLGRSDRWAAKAVEAARSRRERSGSPAPKFDGSILALRKFTSSELLDAGFNISMVAQRQGHGPGVLARHYAKGRASADRRAAEHLGNVLQSDVR